MTNIVTRKGLAFGALVALASTAIAGAPAQAAGELNVVPSAGTSYNALAGTVFNLKTTFAPGFTPSSYAQLVYQIKTDANSAITYSVDTAAVTSPATSVAVSTTAVTAATGGASATSVNYLGLTDTTTSVTSSVEVTAFVDANNDGALTAGEWNTVRTVTFKKVADVTPVVTVSQASTGDTPVKATVNWGDLNVEQISRSAAFGVATGSTNKSLGLEIKKGSGSYAAATYASGTFTGSVSALASGDVVSAKAVYATNTFTSTDAYTSVDLGTAATSTATARTVATVTSALVAGNDAKVGSTATSVATAGGTETQTTAATGDVRKSGTWTAKATLKDAASTPVAVPGVSVTATVKTSATLSGTAGSVKSITVGGTTYTSNTANTTFATVTVVTDASGVASVPVTTVGLANNETVSVTFAAQNLSSLVTATAKDLAYTITEASTASGYATTPSATTTLNYAVKDQFGVAISGAYRVKAVATQNSVARTYYSAPVVAGATTVAVVDAQTTTTYADSVVASLQNQDSSTLNWSDVSATGVTTAILYSTTANGFSTAPAIDATNGINGGAWTTAGDQKQTITQSAIADLTANAAAGATYAKLTFVAANQYENVTVSGTGVYLAVGATAPSADKVTFQAASGTIAIYVAANTVGTKTITFVSGAVTKTVDVKFVSVSAAESTATTFAVTVTGAAQSGRAIDATVTVTDKWGNPVASFDATATVSGVALVNGSAAANVTTDANGKATVKLSAGVNDLGDAVVTFSDNDSATSTDVTAVAKTVTFGATDGYIDVLNGKRASVTWSFAKGKRVAVYLDGVRRYNIIQPGDSELNLQFNLKKGSHSIKLVIGGVIVDDLSVKVAK